MKGDSVKEREKERLKTQTRRGKLRSKKKGKGGNNFNYIIKEGIERPTEISGIIGLRSREVQKRGKKEGERKGGGGAPQVRRRKG